MCREIKGWVRRKTKKYKEMAKENKIIETVDNIKEREGRGNRKQRYRRNCQMRLKMGGKYPNQTLKEKEKCNHK